SSLDAHAANRSPHWKDRALYSCRLHPGRGDSNRGPLSLSRADGGQHSSSASGSTCLYRRKSGDGHHLFHDRRKPIASCANGILRLSPVDFTLRFHVSVPRNAALGTNGWRSFSPDSFSAHRPRHSLEGNSVIDISLELWQIALFALIVLTIG